MGSMSYSTVRSISPQKRAAIAKDAQSIDRDWWCASISFSDARRTNGKLIGNTKLEVICYSSRSSKRLMSVGDLSVLLWRLLVVGFPRAGTSLAADCTGLWRRE